MKIAQDIKGNKIIGDISLQQNLQITWGGAEYNFLCRTKREYQCALP